MPDSYSRFWVGTTRLVGGVWRNIDDGKNTTFFDWMNGEPESDKGYDCALMNNQGLWFAYYCTYSRYCFFCGVPEVNGTEPISSLKIV